MREIEDEVREQRRTRLLARGGPDDYHDEEVFAIVERVLRRAVDERDSDALAAADLGYGARMRRGNRHFHLHAFDYDDDIAFLHTRAAALCAEPEFPDDFTIVRVRFAV